MGGRAQLGPHPGYPYGQRKVEDKEGDDQPEVRTTIRADYVEPLGNILVIGIGPSSIMVERSRRCRLPQSFMEFKKMTVPGMSKQTQDKSTTYYIYIMRFKTILTALLANVERVRYH